MPVDLTVTDPSGINGISSFDLAILYDASKFTVGTISLGTLVSGSNLTGQAFTLTTNTATPGHIEINAFTSGGTVAYPVNTTGSLVTIVFNAIAGATAGASPINLVPQDGNTHTDLADNTPTTLTLNPAPTARQQRRRRWRVDYPGARPTLPR